MGRPTALLMLALLPACPAGALPLHAIFSGTANGSLDGTSFTDASVLLEISFETDDVGPPPVAVPDAVLVAPVMQASLAIGALGTAVVGEAGLFGFNQSTDTLFLRPLALLTPAGDPIPDWMQVHCTSCAGWDLTTPLGPLLAGVVEAVSFDDVATDRGALDLGLVGADPLLVQGVVVPEPSTGWLLASGLALLSHRRR